MARTTADERVAMELAARGLRATRQRVGLLRLLRRTRSHPTAAELHRTLCRGQPNVSLKTVYEILDSLVTAGLAACVTDGGEPYRYESDRTPHYHARCRVCGRLDDLDVDLDEQICARSPIPEGFRVERVAVTFVGRCPRCRNAS
jgi:Fe2+ or Zn2+ uptake regulation protein